MKDHLKRADLTRWNRAGLSRLRYVDGNAITHLETLRQGLSQAFNTEGTRQWPELEMHDTTSAATEAERLQQQYHGPRRDYVWEIMRSLARSAHVLTEHIDANSNETFLGTAAEWENLRKLVALLNYRPAPQASASTALALLVVENVSGTIEKGFGFKTKPNNGSSPVIFETLEDVEVHAALNTLRPANWDRSTASLVQSGDLVSFPLETPLTGISVGDLGVLACGNDFVAVTLAAITGDALQLKIHNPAPGWPLHPPLADTILWLAARSRRTPKISGENVISLPPGTIPVTDGSVLLWRESGSWQAARVEKSESTRLLLDRQGPTAGTEVFLALEAHRQRYVIDDEGEEEQRIILPLEANRESGALFRESLDSVDEAAVTPNNDLYDYIAEPDDSLLYYTTAAQFLESVSHADQVLTELSGKAESLSTGDLLVVEHQSGGLSAARLQAIDSGANSVTIELAPSANDAILIHSHFRHQLRPGGFDKNTDDLTDGDDKIAVENLPDVLKPGRAVIVSDGEKASESLVTLVDRENHQIRLQPPPRNYAAGNTIIYGNAVAVGHGETGKDKVLGSGDASLSNQTFELKVDDLSYLPDPAFISGVRADIEVRVDDRRWQQVDSLDDSRPEDHHYTVVQLASGNVTLQFGDGRHGRRLPTGNNNVRALYRRGAGIEGNIPSGALAKTVNTHPWIDGFLQPIPASGGNDREETASLRENAPASTLALGRAVSLPDFQHLATAQSSVWQATAFQARPIGGAGEIVRVVVVPAGGGELGTLQGDLQTFLQSRALPQVQVNIVPWQPLVFSVHVNIAVDSATFEPDMVIDAVRVYLLEVFSVNLRKLGAPLFRSQILAAVESVAGVSNCSVAIDSLLLDRNGAPASAARIVRAADDSVRRISASPEQLLYLDEALSQITIDTHEWSL